MWVNYFLFKSFDVLYGGVKLFAEWSACNISLALIRGLISCRLVNY